MNSKEEFRKWVLEHRKKISPSEYSKRNRFLVKNTIRKLAEIAPKSIHVFITISKNKEPYTWPIIDWAWENNIKVWSSQTDFLNKRLHPILIDKATTITYSKMGIPSPVATKMGYFDADLILLPLVTADRHGNRLGYGGGFYDRLISSLQFTPIKCGLSLSGVFDLLPFVESHDQPLDWVITPFEIINVGKRNNN